MDSVLSLSKFVVINTLLLHIYLLFILTFQIPSPINLLPCFSVWFFSLPGCSSSSGHGICHHQFFVYSVICVIDHSNFVLQSKLWRLPAENSPLSQSVLFLNWLESSSLSNSSHSQFFCSSALSDPACLGKSLPLGYLCSGLHKFQV